jgi:uncharacterized protein (DUF305 family)
MKRLPALVVALVTVVAATGAIALGVGLANRGDDTRMRMVPGMSPVMGSSAVEGEADYLAEMVAHHREAVAAARELARSERPQMRSFGRSVVRTQSAQIEQMTSWLNEWYPRGSTEVDYQPMMRDLSNLSGDRLDLTFLQDMIGHHMVAVMLSRHLLWRGTDHHEVAQLASAISSDQHAEIVQMRRWLAGWFDDDWRPWHG